MRIEALLAELKEARALAAAIRRDTDRIMEAALSEIFDEPVTMKWPNRVRLGTVVAIKANQVDPRDPKFKKLPHIGGESIESGTCQLRSYRTAEEDGVISGKYLFDAGVVLYSKIRPYLRKVALADFRGLCSAYVYPLLVTSKELFPRFLMWFLVSQPFTQFAIAKSGRARMPKINRNELFSYELPFPSWKEQERIVFYLDAIQSEVEEMRRLQTQDAELLDQVEQSILDRAFRGEL